MEKSGKKENDGNGQKDMLFSGRKPFLSMTQTNGPIFHILSNQCHQMLSHLLRPIAATS
jgi:hypothetical protein